jgi:hypothetical protein
LTEAAPSVLEGSNGFGALQLLGGSGGLNWARWSLTLSSSLPLSHLLLAACCLSLSLSTAIVCCGSNWASSPLLLLAVSHIAAAYFLLNIACCRLLTLSVSLHEYCLLQIAAH